MMVFPITSITSRSVSKFSIYIWLGGSQNGGARNSHGWPWLSIETAMVAGSPTCWLYPLYCWLFHASSHYNPIKSYEYPIHMIFISHIRMPCGRFKSPYDIPLLVVECRRLVVRTASCDCSTRAPLCPSSWSRLVARRGAGVRPGLGGRSEDGPLIDGTPKDMFKEWNGKNSKMNRYSMI